MYKTKGVGGRFGLMALMGLITHSAVAGTMSDEQYTPSARAYSYVATLSAGPAWGSGGQTQTFYLQPNIIKTFTTTRTSTVLADGELFLGLQQALMDPFDGQLGIAVATTSDATLRGNVWDDADPLFNDFTYSYHVSHSHVALKGKLIREANSPSPWFEGVKPYLSGSVGVGFNRASAFALTPLIFEAVPFPAFTSNSTTTFTYTVGAGIQRVISDNWQVGIGYEYADWGKSQLAIAPGQTMGSGLSINHLYTNGLMFNLTYLV